MYVAYLQPDKYNKMMNDVAKNMMNFNKNTDLWQYFIK